MEPIQNIINAELHTIHGWCTVEKSLFMAKLALENNVEKCVELGVFAGRSLLSVALAIKNNNNLKKRIVIGIDPWKVSNCLEGENDVENDIWWSSINLDEMYNNTVKLFEKHQLESIVKLIKSSSSDCVDLFDDETIDMLHQDSNHSQYISCLEVEKYHKKVRVGGFWIFDDTDWSTTLDAQNKLISSGYECIHDFTSWKVFKRMV